ncbi:hypothetical protein [Tenacibaculum sp. 190524A02b]|uniref:hypothetical protein n=1 Tax=Tenacibaculum vairaonense TaxID=3137860 RepID=UPI0031FB0567
MKLRLIHLCFFIIFINISCNSNIDKLFYVDDYNDLVFLANSTNIKEISSKESYLLSDINTLESNFSYKNYGKIYTNENYEVFVIFSRIEIPELQYSAEIKTFNKKTKKVIDSFYLAGYNHDSGELCTGSIDKKLVIKHACDSHEFKIRKRINTFGKIIDITNN